MDLSRTNLSGFSRHLFGQNCFPAVIKMYSRGLEDPGIAKDMVADLAYPG